MKWIKNQKENLVNTDHFEWIGISKVEDSFDIKASHNGEFITLFEFKSEIESKYKLNEIFSKLD